MALVFTAMTLGLIGISCGVQGPLWGLPRGLRLLIEVFEAGNDVGGSTAHGLVVEVRRGISATAMIDRHYPT